MKIKKILVACIFIVLVVYLVCISFSGLKKKSDEDSITQLYIKLIDEVTNKYSEIQSIFIDYTDIRDPLNGQLLSNHSKQRIVSYYMERYNNVYLINEDFKYEEQKGNIFIKIYSMPNSSYKSQVYFKYSIYSQSEKLIIYNIKYEGNKWNIIGNINNIGQ